MATLYHLAKILLPDFKPPKAAKPEAQLCMEIANFLREQSLCRNFPYVWVHVPNQWAGLYKGRFGAELAHMGRINGAPDYAFLGPGGSFFVEVKTPKGMQSDYQITFEKWCEGRAVPYYICRSLKDVERVLDIERVKQETIHQIVSHALSGVDGQIQEDEKYEPLASCTGNSQTVEISGRTG